MSDDSRRRNGRRCFLKHTSLGLAGAALGPGLTVWGAGVAPGRRPKVAAVLTVFNFRSHGHVFLENFLQPYLFNGRRIDPGVDVVSLYVDQFPANDMARDVARQYQIPIYPTIAGALGLGGTELAVDAVLSVAEQGVYPVNAKGQREYPRKRFFDEIVAVFEKSGRVAPVFNDKHLSYRWDWARQMFATSQRLKIPFMAGSSVPLAERRPPLAIPPGAEIQEAVSIHSGPIEVYDFHGLEVLQSVVEARRGGETGVAQVQFLSGEALWQAADSGLWSTRLADSAMAAELGPGQATIRELVRRPPFDKGRPHGIVVTYRDGLRGVVLKVGNDATRWNFACRLAGESQPRATCFHVGPWRNRNLFKALSHAVQVFFRERQAPYPVERTLLTTGILDAAMQSRFEKDKRLDTPDLALSYAPVDFREFRETGATWNILPPDIPEPKGLDPSGRTTQ
jgi:hypothetical protein